MHFLQSYAAKALDQQSQATNIIEGWFIFTTNSNKFWTNWVSICKDWFSL